jgi:CBS domain-containing protein
MAEPNVLSSRVSGGASEYPTHPRVPRLTVGSVLSERQTGLHSIDPGCPSLAAIKLLEDKGLEAALVMDGSRIVGMFSLQIFAHATAALGVAAMTLAASKLMVPCHCVASPDDSAQACMQLMQARKLHFIPVQENERPIALLSRDDLLSELISNYEKVFRESALDQQILFLRGTYSC